MLWPHSNGCVVTSRGDICSVVPGGWGLWNKAALPPYAAPYGFRCLGGGDAELLAQVTCTYEMLVVECGCSPLDEQPSRGPQGLPLAAAAAPLLLQVAGTHPVPSTCWKWVTRQHVGKLGGFFPGH